METTISLTFSEPVETKAIGSNGRQIMKSVRAKGRGWVRSSRSRRRWRTCSATVAWSSVHRRGRTTFGTRTAQGHVGRELGNSATRRGLAHYAALSGDADFQWL